jgi:eukaryotic-like serine/threonine-protein kinase
MAEHIGQQLGNYRLIRLLGEGGFAEVYLGEHVYLGTQAAIKVLHTQLAGEDMDKFRTEARTIAHLEHPHIVRILDFGVEGKTPFLVMSYAPNGTLRQRHPKGAILPVTTIVSYVQQIADALQYAHDEKLIHRDVKPENILVGRRGEVLLSDFGIALLAQTSRYQSTQDVLGTVAYMAPEQIQGKPRPASDQYALGIVLYEWLSGDRPFHGSFTEVCAQHMYASPPPLREKIATISPAIEQVVQTALVKDPNQRFASVKAFATALEQASEPPEIPTLAPTSQPIEPTIASQPPSQPRSTSVAMSSSSQPLQPGSISNVPVEREVSKRGVSRRTVLAGLAGIAVIGIAGGITWFARSQHAQTPPFALSSRQTPPTTPVSHSTPTPHASSPGTTLFTFHGHAAGVNTVAWSPDSSRIASGANGPMLVWDAIDGSNVFSFSVDTVQIYSLTWSPDGHYIASSGPAGTVQVWNASTKSLLYTYRGHSGPIPAVAWSPHGNRIASGSDDHTVQVWDAFTGNNVLTYHGHTDVVRAVAWSPNGDRLVSGGHDTTAQVWDASNGSTIFIYRGHKNRIATVAWSPDGTRITSGGDDTTAQVWSASNGSNVFTYKSHTDVVQSVAWSPRGQHIVSGSHDATARVWDALTGNTVLTYHGHSAWVVSVAWSLDGTRIASGSSDTTAQVWQASSL